MDFKGIDWAGNIHEKFEAMYCEVEETIHQDTMNYVENQLQKVVVSVMKFYGEVLEDLLTPSSCIRPVRGAAKPSTQTDINKKPKSIISDMHGELKNKADVGEDICDSTAEDSRLSVRSDAKHLSTMSPRVLVGNTESGECSKKSKAAGVSRHSIGIKRTHPPKMSRAMSSLSGDKIVCGVRSNFLVSSDDLNVTKSSELFVRHDTGEAVTENKCISDASVESCNSDQIQSTESVKQEKNDSECTCPAPDKDSSAESPRQDNGATNDSFDIEVIETEDVEKSKMEHHFVSQGTKKHKSYKKKIYDMLSLKLRSTRKQDPRVSDEKKSYDFGWELL